MLFQELCRVARILIRIQAIAFDDDTLLWHAERHQIALSDLCLFAAVSIHLPARKQHGNAEVILYPYHRQHTTRRACCKRTHAVIIGHIRICAATEHDDTIRSLCLERYRRIIRRLKPPHQMLSHESRRQEVKHQRHTGNDGRKSLLLYMYAIRRDHEKYHKEYPRRQNDRCSDFQDIDHSSPKIPLQKSIIIFYHKKIEIPTIKPDI